MMVPDESNRTLPAAGHGDGPLGRRIWTDSAFGSDSVAVAWNGGSARGARPPGLAATGLVIGRGALLRWHFCTKLLTN